MATIEEIERSAAAIWAAEANALHNLAAYLRESVIALPVESQLARAFVQRAKTIEAAATQRDLALHGGGELWMLTRDLHGGAPEHPVDVARRALHAAAETAVSDEWANRYQRIASILPSGGVTGIE